MRIEEFLIMSHARDLAKSWILSPEKWNTNIWNSHDHYTIKGGGLTLIVSYYACVSKNIVASYAIRPQIMFNNRIVINKQDMYDSIF